MRFILKLFVGALVTLLVGVTSLGAGLWFYGDRLLGHYKPDIELALSRALNLSVDVGVVRVTLIPTLSLRVEEVTIQGPDGDPPWSIKHANLVADLPALLHRKIELISIAVSGLEGTVLLANGVSASKRQSQNSTPAAEPVPAASPFSLNLHEFRLKDSRLIFKDGSKEWQLEVKDGTGDLSLERGMLSIPNASIDALVSRIPAGLALTNFAFRDGALSLDNLTIGMNGESVQLQGRVAADGRVEATLTGTSMDLKTVAATIAQVKGARAAQVAGKVTWSATLSGTPASLSAAVKLSGRALRMGESRILSLEVPELRVSLSNATLQTASIEASIRGLEIRNKPQSYVADAGSLKLSARNSSGWKIGGTLDAQNFGYSDNATRISKVNATASAINAVISTKGDIVVSAQIDGDSLLLTAPSVDVTAVQKVSSPLCVSVPAAGGYSVTGPVSARGGVVTIEGRKLENLEGTVAILVSAPLKDFTANSLRATSSGQKIDGRLRFTMKNDSYHASLSPLKIAGGEVFASWSMGRGADPRTSIEARASRINIAQAYAAVMQQSQPMDGTLDTFVLNASAVQGKLKETAAGTGSFVFLGEPPKKILPTETLLKAIAEIPGAGNLLVAKDTLDNTRDREMRGNLQIGSGKVSFQNFRAKRTGFNITGDAAISFDKRLEGALSVIFLKDTLRSLSLNIKLLGSLFSAAPKLSIPLLLSGTTDEPKVRADYAQIAKNASGLGFAESVAQGIYSGGRKLLGVFDSNSSSSSTTGPGSSS